MAAGVSTSTPLSPSEFNHEGFYHVSTTGEIHVYTDNVTIASCTFFHEGDILNSGLSFTSANSNQSSSNTHSITTKTRTGLIQLPA